MKNVFVNVNVNKRDCETRHIKWASDEMKEPTIWIIIWSEFEQFSNRSIWLKQTYYIAKCNVEPIVFSEGVWTSHAQTKRVLSSTFNDMIRMNIKDQFFWYCPSYCTTDKRKNGMRLPMTHRTTEPSKQTKEVQELFESTCPPTTPFTTCTKLILHRKEVLPPFLPLLLFPLSRVFLLPSSNCLH